MASGRQFNVERWPTIQHRRDIKPLPSLGLAAFPECFLLIWERAADASAHTRLLFVSEDGTRCALLNPIECLIETWAKMRTSPGRKRVKNPSPKTRAQRRTDTALLNGQRAITAERERDEAREALRRVLDKTATD